MCLSFLTRHFAVFLGIYLPHTKAFSDPQPSDSTARMMKTNWMVLGVSSWVFSIATLYCRHSDTVSQNASAVHELKWKCSCEGAQSSPSAPKSLHSLGSLLSADVSIFCFVNVHRKCLHSCWHSSSLVAVCVTVFWTLWLQN